MPQFRNKRRVRHSASDMFDLVADIERYPQFLPLVADLRTRRRTENADGTYKLTGTGLNGISEGAAYGDDEQMGSNYPLVRMTNAVTGNVYYARTFNWNSTSVMTSNRLITAQFSLPQNLPAGTYSLVTVANGNASDPTNFVYSPPPLPTGLAAFSGNNGFVRSGSTTPTVDVRAVRRPLASAFGV